TAEALAREIAERLRPWNAPPVVAVSWRLLRVPADVSLESRGTLSAPTAALGMALSNAPPEPATDMSQPLLGNPVKDKISMAVSQAREDSGYGERWAEISRTDRVVPPWTSTPVTSIGKRFADLPDPFKPLMTFWTTGYFFDYVDTDAVVLGAVEPP